MRPCHFPSHFFAGVTDGSRVTLTLHHRHQRRPPAHGPTTRQRDVRGITRRWRPHLTRQATAAPDPDSVGRDFTAERPGQRLVGDSAYLPTNEDCGTWHQVMVIDLATRGVIGYEMARPPPRRTGHRRLTALAGQWAFPQSEMMDFLGVADDGSTQVPAAVNGAVMAWKPHGNGEP